MSGDFSSSRRGLASEIAWLRDIGCAVRLDRRNLYVSDAGRPGSDFNFAECDAPTPGVSCIRISTRTGGLARAYGNLVLEGYLPEEGHDINLLREGRPAPAKFGRHVEVDLGSWHGQRERRSSRDSRFFHYIIEDTVVAWYSVVFAADVHGVFDVKVDPGWRGRGVGVDVLRSIPVGSSHFIQTWSANGAALRCYMSAGFLVSELLFRFVSQQSRPSVDPPRLMRV